MISDVKISEFRSRMRGPLIAKGDPDYDDVRASVYNGMIDKRPAFIARCIDVADVIGAVNFGRDTADDRRPRGRPQRRRAGRRRRRSRDRPVGACAASTWIPTHRTGRGRRRWGDVDHATHAFGLAVPSGIISSTGVGGLTLGGGMGYLTRKYGLTIDNLLAVDMVLADGSS